MKLRTDKSEIDAATGALKVTLAQVTGNRLAHIGSEVLQSTFRQNSVDMLQWAGLTGSPIAGGIQQNGVPGAQ